MTALAAGTARATRNDSLPKFATYVMTASKTIYEGALVMVTSATQLALTGADTASCKFVGIATHTATSAASGTTYITVKYDYDELLATAADLTALAGISVSISDDNTVDAVATTTNDVLVGPIVYAPSTSTAWVRIRGSAVA